MMTIRTSKVGKLDLRLVEKDARRQSEALDDRDRITEGMEARRAETPWRLRAFARQPKASCPSLR
jgi:hypothetical protein